jgi:hypothetical protein
MKHRPLLVAAIVSVAASTAVGSAAGREPALPRACGAALVEDWYDGRIDRVYRVECYRDAIGLLPEDVLAYSSAYDDITHALHARLNELQTRRAGAPEQRRLAGNGSKDSSGARQAAGPAPSRTSGAEATPSARDDDSSIADRLRSLPAPLVVVLVLAFGLLAAAATRLVRSATPGRGARQPTAAGRR